MPKQTPTQFLQAVLQAATRHGEDSDPDMEVGDLQGLVWALWKLLPGKEKLRFAESEEFNELIAQWGGKV